MRISVAQTRPVRGDIEANIKGHLQLIEKAIAHKADLIIFPELSLSSYEPELAAKLSLGSDDVRLKVFQEKANDYGIIIGVGAPFRIQEGIAISMMLFHPFAPVQLYFKQYLHADEEPFFVPGRNATTLIRGTSVALAICYEIAIPAHAEEAGMAGPSVYLASVVKNAAGVEKAGTILSEVARRFSIYTIMSNTTGETGDGMSSGGSAIWDKYGKLMQSLSHDEEGILVVDTN